MSKDFRNLSLDEALPEIERLQSQRSWETAARACRAALQKTPGNSKLLFLLSRSMYHMGVYDLAAELLISVIHTVRVNPQPFHVKAVLMVGWVRLRQGKPMEAVRVYLRILRHAVYLVRSRLAGKAL